MAETVELVLERPEKLRLRIGRTKTRLHDDINRGLFPTPIKIGRRASAFVRSEADAVILARIRGASEFEIRALVRDLIAARGSKGRRRATSPREE